MLTLKCLDEQWLLVFDNLDDVQLNPYWPRCLHGAIIVTTQRRNWAHQAVHAMQLDALADEEGSQLILNLLHQPIATADSKVREQNLLAARRLSQELGGLPLLLAHVAGYADSSNFSLHQLLAMLASPSSLTDMYAYDSTVSTNFQYGEPMKKVWSLALQALEPNARETLNILSMLSPDRIIETMLMGEWDDSALDFLHPDMHIKYTPHRMVLTHWRNN